ncbi:hypothetical protein N399_12650 [Bacillus licheniformis CG-B52]|nr:hypothetical protein N399_12650 [Bacillus licheniformis CG-B52]KUL10839.1 hypothetical protein LI17339_13355 [Bacillus licheniformis LMG 17339]TDO58341.1 hypothetical protein DFO71_3705 [Bacillus licheniformis]
MAIQKICQYLCTCLGILSLSFIYVQMFKKTKQTKKD